MKRIKKQRDSKKNKRIISFNDVTNIILGIMFIVFLLKEHIGFSSINLKLNSIIFLIMALFLVTFFKISDLQKDLELIKRRLKIKDV